MSKKSERIKESLFKVFVVLLTVLIIISILMTMLIMFLRYGFPNYQSTDIKAMNVHGSSHWAYIDSDDDILFKYENSKAELCIYSNHNDDFSVAFLKKINLFGESFYDYKLGDDKFFTTFGNEYIKAGKDLYYIFLENDRRIANIDSCGYTPEEHYIKYVDGSDEIHYGYIYVVDTENNHTSNQEFTNYSHSTGKFY